MLIQGAGFPRPMQHLWSTKQSSLCRHLYLGLIILTYLLLGLVLDLFRSVISDYISLALLSLI